MKKIVCLAVLLVAGSVLLIGAGNPANTEGKYEYAIVKWDGPDRLFYNLPSKFEWVHLEKEGVTIPKEAPAEEYCLTIAANLMAKDGWEPITLDSRRMVFRRWSAK